MTGPANIVALLVAAGRGSRAGGDVPKQYREIGGKSVVARAIGALHHPRIDSILLVIGEGQEEMLAAATAPNSLPAFVIGGSERRLSVLAGLDAIEAKGGASHVLVHDAARPFLPPLVIDRLLDALHGADGAAPVLPVADSLGCGAGAIEEVVPREGLMRIQTPQAFRFTEILAAHRAWPEGASATDDVAIARAAGFTVATVEGHSSLDKLTFDSDFAAGAQRMAAGLVSRSALGLDVHAFSPGSGLRLGGIAIPHDRALAGHSDADVALHAVADALLGTIGAGDIGDHFPPSDPRWRGADSAIFVEEARGLIEKQGGIIDHVDLTLICEAPRIGPHRAAMREAIAAMLRLPVARISVKATTTERLGFAGRGEGIAAQAIASVRLPEV